MGGLGGGLMILFVLLLAARCLAQLGWIPGAISNRCPALARMAPPFLERRWKPGPAACVLAFLGVLAAQWLFAWCCWKSLGQTGGLSAFFAHFWQRFTTAGDSPHYLFLAQNGYAAQGENAKLLVFYPLYPTLIRLTHRLLAFWSASWQLAGLLVSQLCWGFAGAAMLRLAAWRLNVEGAVTATLLMALYPFGFFALGIYTESLFLLLCLTCMLAALRRSWLCAGVLGFFAALTRTQGLVLVLPTLFLWLCARKTGKQGLKNLGLLLMPLGTGGYLLLNYCLFGNWLQFLIFQKDAPWYQTTRWIGQNLTQHWNMALEYPGLAPFIYWAQLGLYFAAMALLFWGLHRKEPAAWLIWGGAYLGLCYLPGWLISGGRYMFGCLPLFLLMAGAKRRVTRAALLALSGALLYYFGAFYMQGQAIM